MANFESVQHLVNNMKYSTNKLLPKAFETLEVDNIIDSKVSKDQKRHYLVCFKTWLPEDHLNNELIDEFWRKREEDAKKWQGSQDGESDKENNFISPASSKGKRSFIFPEAQSTTPDGNTPESDKIKLLDIRSNTGIGVSDLPLDLPDENAVKTEGSSELYEEETFDLRIDESINHSPPTQVEDAKPTNFVERLINSRGSPSCSSSLSSGDVSYEQSTSNNRKIPVLYTGEIEETDEHSIDYLVTPTILTSSENSLHRPTLFHLSRNQELCVNNDQSKEDETPIVTITDVPDEENCHGELAPFPAVHERKLVNGERHVDEFSETVYEDGRLSLYDDEPIDGERDFVEFDDTMIDEEGEESDISDFGVDDTNSPETFERNDEKDRNSSDFSDVTPDNIELNKFTPLNTVQVKDTDSRFPLDVTTTSTTTTTTTPAHQTNIYSSTFQEINNKQVADNESDSSDQRSSQTSDYDEQGSHVENSTTNPLDVPASTHNEEYRSANLPEKLTKKRKGKTLDDIVRKISSANEQAAENKTFFADEAVPGSDANGEGNNVVWTNGEDKVTTQELPERERLPETAEMPRTDAEKSFGVPDGNREANVYWSAGKAFHKRNISYKCKFCEHRFDDESLLKDHERSHGQHQCRNCNEVFLTSNALFEHREVAHAFKPRQRYNKCRFCPTLYADPAMLQRHEEIHHLSRSPVTHVHNDDRMGDLPPPLMAIDESQRKFPQYEKQREMNRNDQLCRPRSPRDLNHERKPDESKPYEGDAIVDDDEGKSIVRNPIRNLLGKMYQTQKKLEHGGGERFPHRFSGYRPRLPPSGHQFHYADYQQQHRYPVPQQSKPSPEREYRQDMRNENMSTSDEEQKSLRELVHICRLCNKSFGAKEGLEQHWLTVHVDTPTFSCEVCHEIFIDRDNLGNHMSVHLKKDYYCGYCRKSFDCRANYESHMRAHSNDRPFRCHICGRAFSLRTNLRRHILIHTDITPYRCHICFKGFRRSDMLSSHIKQYHVAMNDEKPRKFDSNEPTYNSEERPGDANISDSVSPVFQPPPSGRSSPYTSSSHDNNNVNGHNESFNDLSPTQHNEEPKVYPVDSRMNKSPDAMSIKHSPTSPRIHHSPNVSMRHESNENMMNHTPNMPQTNHLPNVVALHQMPNPNEHVFHRPPNGMLAPIGSDRPPHRLIAPIPIIKQARFSPYKTNLVNILPLPVASSRMECSECGEKFTSESLYEIHMQSHVKEASYTCRKCRRTFSGKSQYNSHMQTHENNKSHSCPYCHRSFSMKGNLRRHIRIHTNEAPYECPICFQRFRRSDGLKGHIKRHDAMGESAPVDMVPSQASTKTETSF